MADQRCADPIGCNYYQKNDAIEEIMYQKRLKRARFMVDLNFRKTHLISYLILRDYVKVSIERMIK